MNKKTFLSGTLFLSLFISITLFSCYKDHIPPPHNNCPDSLTKDQILVQKTWKVDQLLHVISCQYSSYLDGGTNTTGIPYENLRFKFNADGTGTHIDQFGVSHSLTWQFTTADKRTLVLTIPDLNPSTFTWQLVEIAGNYLHASVNLTIGDDANNLESFRLKQIP